MVAVNEVYAKACQIGTALTEKPKDYFKAYKYMVEASRIASETLKADPTVLAAYTALSIMTTGFAFRDCLKQVTLFPEDAYKFFMDPSQATATDLGMRVCDFFTTSYDFFDWTNLSAIAVLIMPFTLSVTISSALVISSAKRVFDAAQKLNDPDLFDVHRDKLNEKLTVKLSRRGTIDDGTTTNQLYADVAKNVAFTVMGVFLLLGSFSIYKIGAAAMLSIKVLGLTASIFRTYYEKDITPHHQPLAMMAQAPVSRGRAPELVIV